MRRKLFFLILFCSTFLLLSGCSNAGKLYKDGKRCFISGEYEEAAAKFQAAIQDNPNRAIYYIDYGMALIASGDYMEAIKQFDKVILDKDILMVRENNKRALRGKGIAYYQLHEHEASTQAMELALQINVLPELDMDILKYMGSSLTITGKYEEAAKVYSDYLLSDKDDYEILCNRAYAYMKSEDYEASRNDYDQAIGLRPKSFNAYLGKYYLLKVSGDEAGSKKVLEEASAIKATSKEESFNLAKLHFYQGVYYVALPELDEAYTNGYYDAYFYIGEIYEKKNDYDKAIDYFQKYMDEGVIGIPAVYNQIAYCYMKKGDYEAALKYLHLGIDYKHADTMKVLKRNEIIAYEYLGNYQLAMEKLKEYIEVYTEDNNIYREMDFVRTRLIDINIFGNNE